MEGRQDGEGSGEEVILSLLPLTLKTRQLPAPPATQWPVQHGSLQGTS